MNANDLTGTWFLERRMPSVPGERLYDVYGARPSGVIHYGDDGRMMALITTTVESGLTATGRPRRKRSVHRPISPQLPMPDASRWKPVDLALGRRLHLSELVGTALRRALSLSRATRS